MPNLTQGLYAGIQMGPVQLANSDLPTNMASYIDTDAMAQGLIDQLTSRQRQLENAELNAERIRKYLEEGSETMKLSSLGTSSLSQYMFLQDLIKQADEVTAGTEPAPEPEQASPAPAPAPAPEPEPEPEPAPPPDPEAEFQLSGEATRDQLRNAVLRELNYKARRGQFNAGSMRIDGPPDMTATEADRLKAERAGMKQQVDYLRNELGAFDPVSARSMTDYDLEHMIQESRGNVNVGWNAEKNRPAGQVGGYSDQSPILSRFRNMLNIPGRLFSSSEVPTDRLEGLPVGSPAPQPPATPVPRSAPSGVYSDEQMRRRDALKAPVEFKPYKPDVKIVDYAGGIPTLREAGDALISGRNAIMRNLVRYPGRLIGAGLDRALDAYEDARLDADEMAQIKNPTILQSARSYLGMPDRLKNFRSGLKSELKSSFGRPDYTVRDVFDMGDAGVIERPDIARVRAENLGRNLFGDKASPADSNYYFGDVANALFAPSNVSPSRPLTPLRVARTALNPPIPRYQATQLLPGANINNEINTLVSSKANFIANSNPQRYDVAAWPKSTVGQRDATLAVIRDLEEAAKAPNSQVNKDLLQGLQVRLSRLNDDIKTQQAALSGNTGTAQQAGTGGFPIIPAAVDLVARAKAESGSALSPQAQQILSAIQNSTIDPRVIDRAVLTPDEKQYLKNTLELKNKAEVASAEAAARAQQQEAATRAEREARQQAAKAERDRQNLILSRAHEHVESYKDQPEFMFRDRYLNNYLTPAAQGTPSMSQRIRAMVGLSDPAIEQAAAARAIEAINAQRMLDSAGDYWLSEDAMYADQQHKQLLNSANLRPRS
jgi:hypothetical protein